MNRILIKNGYLVDEHNDLYADKRDILIENGMIKKIAHKILTTNAQVIDAKGLIVTAGLIDIHTHAFEGETSLGVNPDVIGHNRGVSTIIDAGSAGVNNIDVFKAQAAEAKTNVFALLNVASDGLVTRYELADKDSIDEDRIKERIKDDFIVGLKARASGSVVQEQGIRPIVRAQNLADECETSLTIHIGNTPPLVEEVLALANNNTIITHAFNGKENNILKSESVIELLEMKLADGVVLDVGHGQDSFNYDIFEQAIKHGIDYRFISTDLHNFNLETPVISQHAVITKLMHCGENYVDLINKVTYEPAQYFGLKGYGELKEGYSANISISSFKDSNDIMLDSDDHQLQAQFEYYPVCTVTSKYGNSEVCDHEIVKEGI